MDQNYSILLSAMGKVIIRNVSEDDLDDILRIDKEVYGNISQEVTSNKEKMSSRISIGKEWFFVAEVAGKVEGFLSLQPTNKPIEKFISWEDSTDDGSIKRTYKENGKYVYGIALTISKSARGLGISELLFKEAAKKMIKNKKRLVYFSGRMPGYYKYKNKMKAKEYYDSKIKKNGKLLPLDPQIRMYESYGLKRVRLVKEGFKGDNESADYSVVFKADNPFYKLPFPSIWAGIFSVVIGNKLLTKLLLG